MGKFWQGKKLVNLENRELVIHQNFPCQYSQIAIAMYLAYALTVAYLPNFSSPIAFTYMVHQNFPPTETFPCI